MDSIAIYNELKTGGAWLGAARSWMQSNVKEGDTLEWGSGKMIHLPFCKLEEFAMRVAVAAVEEDRRKSSQLKSQPAWVLPRGV